MLEFSEAEMKMSFRGTESL